MGKNVIVIGAGASGLMAAAAAAESGHRVTVLEKNEKAGKKIYITGKGRCNLTNDCATEDFFANVARNHKFLYSAVYGFDHDRVKQFMEDNGCPVKVERGNRVFPVSDHASDVTAALLRRLRALGVRVLCHAEAEEILTEPVDGPAGQEERAKAQGKRVPAAPAGGGAALRACGVRLRDGRALFADAVILCTGGLSYPSTGSTGDGLAMARALGLAVTDTAPSLVPFETKEDWCRRLQGLALRNVSVRVLAREAEREEGQEENAKAGPAEDPGKAAQEGPGGRGSNAKRGGRKRKARPVYEGFGELLFTHFGVSGPLLLTASCYCDFRKDPQGYSLLLDLKPALSREELEQRLIREFAAAPNRHLPGAVRPLFPARLAQAVTDLSGLGTDRRAASFTEPEVRALAALIKGIRITLVRTRGYNEAIITRGGIDVKEFNPSTMESKRIGGLFAAGEVLDVDARTGGFNLQIAWSTGHLAGSSV